MNVIQKVSLCWVGAGAEHLRRADPALGRLMAAGGDPPRGLEPHPRVPGGCFEALAKSVAFQQLAGKAAGSIWARVVEVLGGRVEPGRVLRAPTEALRVAGLSGRKAECIRSLAKAFEAGELSDTGLESAGESAVVEAVTAVKGIGAWTADMFLIFHLRRADVLPVGDLGVRKGFAKVYGLSSLPDAAQMRDIAEKWRPFRSVGALYMWQAADERAPKSDGAGKGKKRRKPPQGTLGVQPVEPPEAPHKKKPRGVERRMTGRGG